MDPKTTNDCGEHRLPVLTEKLSPDLALFMLLGTLVLLGLIAASSASLVCVRYLNAHYPAPCQSVSQ